MLMHMIMEKSISNDDLIQYSGVRKHHRKLVDAGTIMSRIQQALDSGKITQEEAETKLERLAKGKDFIGKHSRKIR